MFRQRLLTSLILVPLVLLAIYCANMWLLAVVVLGLTLVGAWEWTQLIPIKHVVNKVLFSMAVLLAVGLSRYWLDAWLIVGLLSFGFLLIAVLTFPVSQTLWGRRYIVAGFCLLLLPLFANILGAIYEHTQGKSLIVYLLCLVWATDIGAYLAGKQCGRHKLIPRVSPGKTIEGAVGGFLLALFVAVLGYVYFHPHFAVAWYVVAIAVSLMSMLGDLLVSMLKRRSKLKDTGQIFPGHGGVLDRLDSLIAAAPLFYYGLSFVVIPS